MEEHHIQELFDLGEIIAKLEERSVRLYERLGRESYLHRESDAALTRLELQYVQSELQKQKKRLEGFHFPGASDNKEERS